MITYLFNGKVIPERADVNVTATIVNIEAKDAGFSGKAIVSISCSQVSVKFDTIDVNIGLLTLKNYMEYVVRTLVDAYGYLSGRGYDVEITSVVDPDGKQTVFGVGIRELEKAKDERPLSFKEILLVMSKSPDFHYALGDLREAIRSPFDTGFFCYRAVECLRQGFIEEEDDNDEKKSWERLRNALNIDRSWIDKIKEFADAPRHGSFPYISGEDRLLVMQHAWKVMDRFAVYVHRGFNPLPKHEFALLLE